MVAYPGMAVAIPLLGSILVLIIPNQWARRILAVILPVTAVVLLVPFIPGVFSGEVVLLRYVEAPGFALNLLIDGLTVFFGILAASLVALSALYSWAYIPGDQKDREYYFFTLVIAGALLGLVHAENLLLLYVFWELATVAMWRLVTFQGGEKEYRAADKAFIVTFGAASFMLVGFVLVYAETGTLSLLELKGRELSYLPIFFILVGIMAKSAFVPFHTWLADAHSAAPAPMSAILSGVVAKIGLVVFLRVMAGVAGVSTSWLLALAGLTAIVGAGAALVERDIKRIIACSTVSQIGFMTLGLGLMTKAGISAGLLYLGVHAVAKAGLFLAAGIVEHHAKTRDIDSMSDLFQELPLTGWSFLLLALCIIGFPPLGGFFAKISIIMALVSAGHYFLAVLGIIATGLTLLYFLRLFAGIFGIPRLMERLEARTRGATSGLKGGGEGRTSERFGLILVPPLLLAAITVLIGVLIAYPLRFTDVAAEMLLR